MLPSGSVKAAFKYLRTARWQSFLTMLGIIIGVASVVVTVSIGEGVKNQIQDQASRYGEKVLTVRSGNYDSKNDQDALQGLNLASLLGSTSLADKDYKLVSKTEGVEYATPYNIVSGSPIANNKSLHGSLIVGSTQNTPILINQELEFGAFFDEQDPNPYSVVIGKKVADQLFDELAPLGKSIKIRNKEFVVRGVFKEFNGSSLLSGIDYNRVIFMPYDVSQELLDNQSQIFQILVKPKDGVSAEKLKVSIQENMLKSRGNSDDFTVLNQQENLQVQSSTLNLLTKFIAGVAAISLLVGGIGIMNIMLVLISERTREIGVRKAVGATNRQIMLQFLTESSVISFVGGLLGIIVALITNYLIRLFTDLQPQTTWQVVLISLGVSLSVGIIFGTMPALRAARKDPIEALRHE